MSIWARVFLVAIAIGFWSYLCVFSGNFGQAFRPDSVNMSLLLSLISLALLLPYVRRRTSRAAVDDSARGSEPGSQGVEPTAETPGQVDLDQASAQGKDWWKRNPNKTEYCVSGACHVSVRGDGYIRGQGGEELKELKIAEQGSVVIASGTAEVKFSDKGSVSWLQPRADGTAKEASVCCLSDNGGEVRLRHNGDIDLDSGVYKAVNCGQVSCHQKETTFECQGCDKVFAAGDSELTAHKCGDVYVTKFCKAVVTMSKLAAAQDHAVLYAEQCESVHIQNSARVKTRGCGKVLHSNTETSVWEKAD